MAKEFEILQHTADLKIRAYGNNLQELFRNALKGMFASIKPISKHIKYKDDEPIIGHYNAEHKVVVHSIDIESLLVDFLSECLYLSDVNDEAYFDARFNILSSEPSAELQATIFGVKITGFEVVEIKAVTYHDLFLNKREDGSFEVTIVFDI